MTYCQDQFPECLTHLAYKPSCHRTSQTSSELKQSNICPADIFHLNVKLVLVYYRSFHFLFVVLRISGVAVNCSIWHQRLLACRTVPCGTRLRPSGQRSCPRCSVDFRSFERFRRHFFITCSQCLAEQLTVKVQFWRSVLQRGAKMADCIFQLNLLSFGF